MKERIAKKILIITSIITTTLTACGNIGGGNKEESTRIPNSVVGRWYQYDGDGWLNVWIFQENGVYYSDEEEWIDKEDETYRIARSRYKIDGDTIILDGMEATLKYTDYGFYIKYKDHDLEKMLCEYRQDALEFSDDYFTSYEYLMSLKDENGCVIKDGVLIKYFTNESEIVIPDNVTGLGGFVIASELEEIDKLTIPGNVKEIGASAFCEVPLGVVIIEEGVEKIGRTAFEDSYFNEIHIPSTVNSISSDAFRINEGRYDAKIYVKKGSYAENYFKENSDGKSFFGAEIIVEE